MSESGGIQQKAVKAALLLAMRGSAVRALGLIGTLFLARLVAPSEFGLLAAGLAICTVGVALAEGGLGAALMRGEDPSPDDLRAVVGFQLAASLVLAAVAVPLCLFGGTTGLFVGLGLVTVPIMVLRIPSYIMLERELNFGRTVVADLAETVGYYLWAVGALSAGTGLWALAAAPVVKAIVGTVVLMRISPVPWVRPMFSMTQLRPILKFGVYFQGATLLSVLRQQGRDLGIGAIGGAYVLGLWSLAFRLLQVPFLLFESLWRVSYPALARLIESGTDPRRSVEKAITLGALGGGAITGAIVAGAPSAVPLLFGNAWKDSVDLLVLAGLGIVVSSPISVVAIGFLYAVGRADDVFRLTAVFVAVGLSVTFIGLPLIGNVAIGLGWISQATVGVILLGRRLQKETPVRLIRCVGAADIASIGGTALGWVIASGGDSPTWIRALIGATIPVATVTVVALLVERDSVKTFRTLAGSRSANAAAGSV